LIVALLLFTAGLSLGFLFWVAKDFVSPSRSPIQESRMSWIESPEKHGIVTREGRSQAGKTPYLLISPDPLAGVAERGRILRSELEDREVELPLYGTADALVVLLHGRRGRKESMFPIAERICAAGFHCLIPDLPASGGSGHLDQQFATSRHGITLVPDLLQSVAMEHGSVLGAAQDQVFIWGQSLGGCFGVRAASELGEACRGLIVVSTFDQLAPLVRDRIGSKAGPLTLPCLLFIRPMVRALGGPVLTDVRPDLWAKAVGCPVLVVHGDADRLIAEDRGRALHSAFASADKTWLSVSGAGHNNALITDQPVYATMAKWMRARLLR